MPPTILFQPPNGIGLGHISRLGAIAAAVRERRPDAKLPFLIEGADHLLLESLGFPHLSLPYRGALQGAAWARWTPEERDRLCDRAADALVEVLQPRVAVFDLLPFWPVAHSARRCGARCVLVLRKMRDLAGYCSSLGEFLDLFDLIVFPHDRAEIELPAAIESRARFVGTIRRRAGAGGFPPPEPPCKRIVITGGAGGNPGTVDFYKFALSAVAQCGRSAEELDVLLVTGPLFREWPRLWLLDGARVLPFEPDLPCLIAASDLVICQAGYNTVAEIRGLGTPAICLPGERLIDDQLERALAAAHSMPGFEVFEPGSAEQLAARIEARLNAPRPTREELAPAGADRAAELLLELADRSA